jgi:hypothetical protein
VRLRVLGLAGGTGAENLCKEKGCFECHHGFDTREPGPSSENYHPSGTIDAALQGLLIAFGLLSLCRLKAP